MLIREFKNIKFWLFIVISYNTQLFSAIGCMSYPHSIDKSEHELYRPVACNCPCQRISPDRGECSDCRHFGNPDRGFRSVNQDLR